MKISTGAAVFLAIFLSFTSMAAHASMETFDSGADGWGTSLINSTGYSWYQAPTYSPSGGNPGGYISGSVGADVNSRLYSFDSPSSPFGSLTGQTLTVDVMTSGTVTTTAGAGPAMARFYIGSDSSDYFISTNAYSISLNNSGGWITYTIPVTSADFMAWPGQTGTTPFADVAANALSVGLLFTSADFSAANDSATLLGLTSANGAIISIDNFGTVAPAGAPVPIPAGAWLLGSGLTCLVGLRRKLLNTRVSVQQTRASHPGTGLRP